MSVDTSIFAEEIVAFASKQASWSEAARRLSISRVDLYRYKNGVKPRRSREAQIRSRMLEFSKVSREASGPKGVQLSRESVTLIRNTLMQLVEAIDLDLLGADGQLSRKTNPRADRRIG